MTHNFPRFNRLSFGAAAVCAPLMLATHANAAVVTLWEEQFSTLAADWTDDGTDVTIVTQAYAGPGATDGSELLLTPTTIATSYLVFSIPSSAVAAIQAGDAVEISARSAWPQGAALYLELIGSDAGSAAIVPLGFHDENGNGTGYSTRSAILDTALWPTGNLWLGVRDNDSSDGFGFGGIDYIRITGERAIPEPATLSIGCASAALLLRRRHKQ